MKTDSETANSDLLHAEELEFDCDWHALLGSSARPLKDFNAFRNYMYKIYCYVCLRDYASNLALQVSILCQ